MESYDMRVAVAKGAALLDERKPAWWDSVVTSALNMSEYDRCIVSQVYRVGDYPGYANALVSLGATRDMGYVFAIDHGFDLPMAVPEDLESQTRQEAWQELGDEWQAVIAERRNVPGCCEQGREVCPQHGEA